MFRKLIILIFTALPFAVAAQSVTPGIGTSLNNPFDFHMQTGMSAGTTGFGGSFVQSYLSPSFALPVNKKLTVSAGVSYSHTMLNNLPVINMKGEAETYSGSMNTLTVYSSGLYRVNDKLSFTGSAFKAVNPSFNNRLSPEALQMEAKGVSFGVDYRLGENATIGGEIRIQQGNSNFYSPYNRPYSPFFRP